MKALSLTNVVFCIYSHTFYICHITGCPARTTLIIGDDTVNTLAGENPRLQDGSKVMWCGENGLKIGGLLDLLKRYLDNEPSPTTIMIHIGANDLFNDSITSIRATLEETFSAVRTLCPDSQIIWSNIIQQPCNDLEGVSRKTSRNVVSNINRFAQRLCLNTPNMGFIKNGKDLRGADHSLFLRDRVGWHLTEKGNRILMKIWDDALVYFSNHPESKCFPPSITGCPAQTLIIGDDTVSKLAGRDIQLGGGGKVMWCGEKGLKIEGLLDLLNRCLKNQPSPTTIMLHVGTNDLFNVPLNCIRIKLEETFTDIRTLHPNSQIVWSNIIKRPYEVEGVSWNTSKNVVRNINRFAQILCMRTPNTCIIKNGKDLRCADHSLFLRGQVGGHLTEKGNQILLRIWDDALVYFNNHPESKCFPPEVN